MEIGAETCEFHENHRLPWNRGCARATPLSMQHFRPPAARSRTPAAARAERAAPSTPLAGAARAAAPPCGVAGGRPMADSVCVSTPPPQRLRLAWESWAGGHGVPRPRPQNRAIHAAYFERSSDCGGGEPADALGARWGASAASRTRVTTRSLRASRGSQTWRYNKVCKVSRLPHFSHKCRSRRSWRHGGS